MHDPQRMAALRQAISDGWADVVGGTYSEAEDPLLPLESILWQFRRGDEVYRAHLDDRNVETFARRRFGLYPQLPADRQTIWISVRAPPGLRRRPIPDPARDQAALGEPGRQQSGDACCARRWRPTGRSQGWLLPWRMAATMKDDHVAALPLVHWPKPVAPWYLDLRRAASYSPVLGRWTTLNDFFHLTDRPYETFRPEPDKYQTPYLAQAVARREPRADRAAGPSSSAAGAARGGADDPCAGAGDRVVHGRSSDGRPATPADLPPIDGNRKPDRDAAVTTRPRPHWRESNRPGPRPWRADIARHVDPDRSASAGRPGYLVINPLNVPRRAAVVLPDAALDLRPDGPLRAAQFTDEGVWAVVDLPAFGFAWVPKEADSTRPPAPSRALSARGRQLRNESIEVEIDATPAAFAAWPARANRRPGSASNWS